TELDPGDLQAEDASFGAPFVIGESLGQTPFGERYRARQDNVPVLLTVADPVLVAEPDIRAALERDLERARRVSHRSLLPIYGFGRTTSHFLVVEADPGGGTVRDFAMERIARGKRIDPETAYTLTAHVCNALAALHAEIIHGYVTADTVLVSNSGRVFLGAA